MELSLNRLARYATMLLGAAATLGNTPCMEVDTSFYPNTKVFWSGKDVYTYSFSWNVTVVDATPTLFGLMTLAGPSGIGFGQSMLDAQFIVCHNWHNDSSVTFHQHVSTGIYFPPDFDNPRTVPLTPVAGKTGSGIQRCVFSRALSPNDGFHTDITGTISMLWAFNPDSKPNFRGGLFDFHGFDYMGRVQINYQTGVVSTISIIPTLHKKIHAFGMMFIWMVLLPAGVFLARYMRSYPGWLNVKIGIQVFSVLGLVALIIVVSTNWYDVTSTHAKLGWSMLALILLQSLLGTANVYGLYRSSSLRLKKRVKLLHQCLGYSILAISVVQMGYGINNLYPWIEPQNLSAWYVYFVVISFWFIAFQTAEFVNQYNVKIRDAGYQKLDARQNLQYQHRSETSGRYTWKDIGSAIDDGKILVVANGKYVYDVTKWIDSHPGGRHILRTVAGTDISNEYFHNAGFDASQFSPKKKAPKKLAESRQSKAIAKSSEASSPQKRDVGLESKYIALAKSMEEQLVLDITNEEWTFITKARRTHVHSRMAIERLSKLLVGEVDVTRSKGDDEQSQPGFDPYELRRYALVEVEDLSTPETQYARFKFCLLYPYDKRRGQPFRFLPGQS
ncbi:hypothetical protein HDU91_001164, partial [Kappamyces sp. JEL0680]